MLGFGGVGNAKKNPFMSRNEKLPVQSEGECAMNREVTTVKPSQTFWAITCCYKSVIADIGIIRK